MQSINIKKLQTVARICSKSTYRKIVSSILIKVVDGRIIATATDNYKLIKHDVTGSDSTINAKSRLKIPKEGIYLSAAEVLRIKQPIKKSVFQDMTLTNEGFAYAQDFTVIHHNAKLIDIENSTSFQKDIEKLLRVPKNKTQFFVDPKQLKGICEAYIRLGEERLTISIDNSDAEALKPIHIKGGDTVGLVMPLITG